jgi:type II secretory pathway pseudopilin PulG
MPIFQAKRWFHRRVSVGRDVARAEDGFLMVEVIISALLVGMIAVATINGFGVANRATADERRHNEAAVLASESQEQMRSNSAIALHELAEKGNSYTRTVGGTIFTIKQSATPGNGAGQTGCVAAEAGGKGKGVYFLITSTVTWERTTDKPVVQSSIVTPPTGSALEVEVSNGEVPTQGVTASVTYTPNEGSGATTIEGTTGAQGCVLFAGLPTTSAVVEIKETKGIVNAHGTLSWPPKTVTLAPNVVTPDPVELAPGGALEALYRFNKSATYTHKNNSNKAEISEEVTGDTFVAFNQKMAVEPYFETGTNSKFAKFGAGGLYEAILATPVGTYGTSAVSPKELVSNYPTGNLFPFPAAAEGKWTAYAGDCTANNPKTYGVTPQSTSVTGGAPPAKVEVPTAYLQLEVFKGTAAAPGELEMEKSGLATITNKGCAGATPNNATAVDVTHTQATTIGPEWGGHLQAPFQPFGKFELCLLAEKNAVKRTYTLKEPYVLNNATEKLTRKIFLGEASSQEIETTRLSGEAATKKTREETELKAKQKREGEEAATQTKREQKEAETKAARETAEAPAKTKREGEEAAQKTTKEKEATTKANRLAAEKAEKEKWESEEKAKPSKLTKKEREAKEATQTTNRKTAEKNEKTAAEKRETEEAKTKSTRESEEKTRATKEKEEATTRKNAETAEATAQTTAEAKEATTRTAAEATETTNRKNAEKAEEKTLETKEVVVETGKASC